jgi:Sulfate permease family
MVAGLPGAISRVPDGMAAAILAGVNPVQGLYASFAGPIVGGLSSNTRMMVISTTSAAALAAGPALQNVAPDQRPAAISLLVILVGIALVGAGGYRRAGGRGHRHRARHRGRRGMARQGTRRTIVKPGQCWFAPTGLRRRADLDRRSPGARRRVWRLS